MTTEISDTQLTFSYKTVRDDAVISFLYHRPIDSIDDKKERKNVLDHLTRDGKEIIAITEDQMHAFAGNMLQVLAKGNQPALVMSSSAYHSLTQDQIDRIEKYGPIIHSPLPTVETCGGGSARCMMAEVFLPEK